ncbi:IS5 family transposase [Sphingomonas sp. LB2R24]|uniref:IS5 family transposase n=1 Tax=Sphingomonas sorbitolis TaxID=3096165 RepID=UPI002FCC0EA2
MDRDVLTDAQWAKMKSHCLGKVGDLGRRGANNRLFMEAVMCIARTDSPWRDLPERFGNWSTAIRRFCDWRAVMSSSVSSKRCQMSLTWSTPWSTRRSSRSTATDRSQKGAQSQAIGRSKGCMTTKILALTDALGNLVRFRLMPGRRFDSVEVPPLIDGIGFDGLIADKAFESNSIYPLIHEHRARDAEARGARRSRCRRKPAAWTRIPKASVDGPVSTFRARSGIAVTQG